MSARNEAGLGDDGADGELGDGGGVAPGRVDDQDVSLARSVEVDIDRAAARDRDQLERGQAFEHGGGKRRELSDDDVRVADKADDLVGVALVLLEAVHPGRLVAVAHRLVGPGHLHGFDLERARLSAL